jgi:hypothetical protein
MRTHYIPHRAAAPFCPVGHLPHRGGDQLGACSAHHISLYARHTFFAEAKVTPLVISPLVGEMAGRPEGGNSTRQGSSSAVTTTRKGQPQ